MSRIQYFSTTVLSIISPTVTWRLLNRRFSSKHCFLFTLLLIIDFIFNQNYFLRAARMAELHKSILSWPKGYDTQVQRVYFIQSSKYMISLIFLVNYTKYSDRFVDNRLELTGVQFSVLGLSRLNVFIYNLSRRRDLFCIL